MRGCGSEPVQWPVGYGGGVGRPVDGPLEESPPELSSGESTRAIVDGTEWHAEWWAAWWAEWCARWRVERAVERQAELGPIDGSRAVWKLSIDEAPDEAQLCRWGLLGEAASDAAQAALHPPQPRASRRRAACSRAVPCAD